MMKRFFLWALVVACISGACSKEDPKKTQVSILYQAFSEGSISECQLNGETVFTAQYNRQNSPTAIFSLSGRSLGTCDYTGGNIAPICNQLLTCKVVYRCKGHISGAPAVDLYDVSSGI
jgi:hypothetical protein